MTAEEFMEKMQDAFDLGVGLAINAGAAAGFDHEKIRAMISDCLNEAWKLHTTGERQ